MTWDEKLGLLVGVALVVLVALVYYKPEGGSWRRKDPAAQVRSGQVQLSPMRPEKMKDE